MRNRRGDFVSRPLFFLTTEYTEDTEIPQEIRGLIRVGYDMLRLAVKF